MPTFVYQAYKKNGDLEMGELEVSSADEGLRILNERGLLPFQIEPGRLDKSSTLSSLFAAQDRKLAATDYADFTQELATLLQAELPLDDALRLMSGQSGNARIQKLSASLLESITAGTPLSLAIRDHVTDAPPILASMLAAGEARGNLGESLEGLAKFFAQRVEVREKIRSALTYPLILAFTALLTIGVILAVLIPALTPMFEDTGAPLPIVLSVGKSVSDMLHEHWPVLLAALCVVATGAWLALRREPVRRMADSIILKLPLFGPITQKTNISLFARSLGALLHSGVALLPALKVSASVIQNRIIATAVSNTIDDVKEGTRLAVALGKVNEFPENAVRFVTIGEESSRLDHMLVHLADLYDKEVNRTLGRLLTLLSPAITIVIGVLIGGLILSVIQAMLSVNDLAFQ